VIVFPGGGPNLELETNGNALGSFTLVADASKGLVYSSVGQASSKSYVHSWAGVRIGNILSIDGQTMNASNTLGEPYSRHRAGCNFAFADGSVRALHASAQQEIMFALASSAGHDVVLDPF
jgi:prepilin-type processing-associated H-X9-DG protein